MIGKLNGVVSLAHVCIDYHIDPIILKFILSCLNEMLPDRAMLETSVLGAKSAVNFELGYNGPWLLENQWKYKTTVNTFSKGVPITDQLTNYVIGRLVLIMSTCVVRRCSAGVRRSSGKHYPRWIPGGSGVPAMWYVFPACDHRGLFGFPALKLSLPSLALQKMMFDGCFFRCIHEP